MQIRNGALSFPKAKDEGPRTANTTLVFDHNVKEAAACLTGFNAQYGEFDAHELGKLEIKLTSSINQNTVNVVATYGLRDSGERYDQHYEGTVWFSVLAELMP